MMQFFFPKNEELEEIIQKNKVTYLKYLNKKDFVNKFIQQNYSCNELIKTIFAFSEVYFL